MMGVNRMRPVNLPGFTAAVALQRGLGRKMTRRIGGLVRVQAEAEVQPSQMYEMNRIDFPFWARPTLGDVYFRTADDARQFSCMHACYLRCLEKNIQNPHIDCLGAAQLCCRYDFFCSYCDR
jgi:hypothetical protein